MILSVNALKKVKGKKGNLYDYETCFKLPEKDGIDDMLIEATKPLNRITYKTVVRICHEEHVVGLKIIGVRKIFLKILERDLETFSHNLYMLTGKYEIFKIDKEEE